MAKKRRSSQFKDSSQVIDIEEARRKRYEKRSRQHKKAKKGSKNARKKTVRPSIKQNKRRKKVIYTAIVAFIIAVVGISIFNIISLQREQKIVMEHREELKALKEDLEQELKHINDPDYIEEQARTQLRLVLPGEKIYVFPSGEESDKDGNKKQEKQEETDGD